VRAAGCRVGVRCNVISSNAFAAFRSRYELITLSERDLADMGMTRLDAFNESIKPFWEE
jgi:hypothetical protein